MDGLRHSGTTAPSALYPVVQPNRVNHSGPKQPYRHEPLNIYPYYQPPGLEYKSQEVLLGKIIHIFTSIVSYRLGFCPRDPFCQVTGCGASSGGSWRRLRFNGQTEQSGWV